MESTNYNLTLTPRMLAGLAAVVVVAALYIGAHFLYTTIGSLKGQIAEQQKQLEEAKKQQEEAKKQNDEQQAQINQVVQFLNQAIQQSQAK
jgi:Sec-independent protein translocase protein TatA